MTVFSPFRDVTFHLTATLHRVLESSEFVGVIAGRRPKMSFRGCSVFWERLRPDAWSRIVRLVFIELLEVSIWPACLRQGPARHVLLLGWVGWSFWDVTAWTDRTWRWGRHLKAVTTPKSKGVQGGSLYFWFITWEVLRPWVLLQVVRLHLKTVERVNTIKHYLPLVLFQSLVRTGGLSCSDQLK